jgi:hypothetical protein
MQKIIEAALTSGEIYTKHGHKLRFFRCLSRGAEAACSVHGSRFDRLSGAFELAQSVGFNRLSKY